MNQHEQFQEEEILNEEYSVEEQSICEGQACYEEEVRHEEVSCQDNQDKQRQLCRQEFLLKAEEFNNSPAVKAGELTAWFNWYDSQVNQYNRAMRTGAEWNAAYQGRAYHSIEELDADAEIKQQEVKQLREALMQEDMNGPYNDRE